MGVGDESVVSANIAVALSRDRNVQDALIHTATKFRDGYWQANALRGVAAAQAKAGDVSDAIM